MIDKDELRKILPELIREDDAIRGAVIAALAGIIATKDDIQELMREMDRRFDMMVTELADQRRVTVLLKKFIKERLGTMGEQITDVHKFMGDMRDWMNAHND